MNAQKTKTGIARLFQNAGKRRGMLVVSSLLAVVFAVLSLVPYVLVFYIIQELAQVTPDFSAMRNYLVYAVIAAVVGVVFMYASTMFSHVAAFNILFELRKFIAEKVGKLSLGSVGNKPSGAFKKILYDDVERIELFIAHQIPDLVKGIALPVLTITYLFTQDWRLALVSFLPLLVLAIWMPLMYTNKRNAEIINNYHRSHEEMNAGIVEYVRAMPVMKIFGQSAETFDKYGGIVKRFYRFTASWIRSQSSAYAVFMSFVGNATLPILALGLFLYFRNGVSLSVLLLFLILGTGYIRQLFGLSSVSMQISMINRGVKQFDELLDEQPLPENDAVQQPENYGVRFENVSFAYDGAHDVLKNIHFEARENTITALVGPSGAGKSTVAQLIARFWDVHSGNIRVGGIPIRDFPQEQLMKLVSFVFQDSFMFQQSMYENLRMGMDRTRSEVENAAKSAQIHDLIMGLPKGYATLFGESGIHLSGGEQQRFQLARAILKNAPILILDEATAFSDPENEHKIQQAFSELIQNKTVIVIAHRLSTITSADNIIVFDKGAISAQGTHAELLENSDLYQKMWNAHTRAKEFVL